MKHFRKITSLFLVMSLLLVAGCSSKSNLKSSNYISHQNLMADIKPEGDMSGKEGGHFDIKFASPTAINTVVLKEKGSNITEFSIQSVNAQTGAYETIYTQDAIGAYRYCAFDKITTTGIRILISGATEKYKITAAEVYNINHLIDENESDFRSTTYMVADRIYDKAAIDSASLDAITDIILFGVNVFDEKGNISYQDKEINGQMIPGKQVFDTAIANLKEVIGEREINVYINFLGPDSQSESKEWKEQNIDKGERHNNAFKSSGMVKYIGQFVKDHQIDGVFFDYEFPLVKSQAKVYSNFLVELKKEIGDKKLGVAQADWNLNLTKKAYASLDMIELMMYDLFDERGNHASFEGTVQGLETIKKHGIELSKVDLGIPFYARPTDGEAFWYNYNSESATLGKFKNFSNATLDKNGVELPHNQVGRYYNSYQMTFDKTAFAMNYGVGGVMVWHYSCDLPYQDDNSLFRSINNAIVSRSK